MDDVSLQVGGADPEFEKLIVNGLVHHNCSRTGGYDSCPLTVRLKKAGRYLGGLVGRTYWGWLHIETVWVEEKFRGLGYGEKIVLEAEFEAGRRGCHGAFLDTFDFQAKPFYEKLGYSIFGQLNDFPAGHSRYYMKKRLTGVSEDEIGGFPRSMNL